jgi:hypothetical protein
MHKIKDILWGFLLISLGGLFLAYNLDSPWVMRLIEIIPWHLWSVAVIILGALLILSAIFARQRNMGGWFIAGLPILTAGCILYYTNQSDTWEVWGWLWPMMIISLATGFMFALWRLKIIWMLIPTFVLGTIGLLLQYCALTGNWSIWAVFWSAVPLSVGLALLCINIQKKVTGLLIAGTVLCCFAGIAMFGMSMIIPSSSWIKLVGPSLLLFTGLFLLFNNLKGQPQVALES